MLDERFWSKVDQSGDCWLWTASKQSFGYGQFRFDGRPQLAHRLSWINSHGPIPDETPFVCHHCDTPACVNPDHLFLGDQRANMGDAANKGRTANANTYKTHCKRGHEFTPSNTASPPSVGGRRLCKTCRRERERQT